MNNYDKLKVVRENLFHIFNDVYRNLAFFVLILLFLKLLFNPSILMNINVSVFLIGVTVAGTLKLVLE